MSPSVRYYSNVVAKTHSGLQTTASSDGVMVDAYKPICGSVYDGIGKINRLKISIIAFE